MNKKSQEAFTLVEMMIVLSIISITTGMIVLSFSSLHKSYETKRFLEQFESDLYYAQQLAINNGSLTQVIFHNQNKFYGIRQQNQIVYQRNFNENIKFEESTMRLNEVVFNANGNIGKAGTLTIRIDNERYALVFMIGKGRFYIEKR